MIRHLFTLIWNERRSNVWIVLEYILVFCILWFCCDYLYYIGKCYYEPLGFDIDHTYRITLVEKRMNEDDPEKESLTEDDRYTYALTVLERLQQHPAIESVSLSRSSIPYNRMVSRSGFFINADSAQQSIRHRSVSTGFFDVFKMKLAAGNIFDWRDPVSGQQMLISPERDGRFGERGKEMHRISDVDSLKYSYGVPWLVIGQTEKVKDTFYEPYTSNVFIALEKEYVNLLNNEIAIRVRPGEAKGFEERFIREMREPLSVGPYVLANIVSVEKLRENAARRSGVTDNLNSVCAITLFLIANIFLGIIGTFWYRTESRKSEIGLRMALGASRREVKRFIYTETLLLLFISAVIGVNICINIAQSDLLRILGIPASNPEQAGFGIERHFINFGLTYLFLAVVSLVAVWYPAKQSSDIPPAEALQEE